MSSKSIIYIVFSFVLYSMVQVLLLKNMVLFDVAFCFVYIAFVLMLPLQISSTGLIIAGFAMGFTIDIFYDSLGINAGATTLIAFLRPTWLRLITPRAGYENINLPALKTLGRGWFTIYALPLIFIHHMMIFYVEAGGFNMFFFTLSKVISSTIFTFLVIVLSQYMFYKARE